MFFLGTQNRLKIAANDDTVVPNLKRSLDEMNGELPQSRKRRRPQSNDFFFVRF